MYEERPFEPAPVPMGHPLRELFYHLISQTFHTRLGILQREISAYLTNMMVDFTHSNNLCRLRDAAGLPLQEVTEMLLEADVSSHATSFDQERAVHKHIGDFTLFWAGVYPESLRRLRAPNRADNLIDYVQQGKQSYYIVSTFQHGRYAEDAGLFRALSEEFELCLHGLHLVRREWEQMGHMPRPG